MRFFKIIKKKKKTDRKEELKKRAFKETNKLNYRKKDVHNSFTKIMRSFFSEYFRIKYEFSYEELKKELMRKRIKSALRQRIFEFLESYSNTKFSSNRVKAGVLKGFVQEFRQIIEELI